MVNTMRNLEKIIDEMLEIIPEGRVDLVEDLNKIKSAYLKVPEEKQLWTLAFMILLTNIPNPVEDWQFKVISIFTEEKEEMLKEEFAKVN